MSNLLMFLFSILLFCLLIALFLNSKSLVNIFIFFELFTLLFILFLTSMSFKFNVLFTLSFMVVLIIMSTMELSLGLSLMVKNLKFNSLKNNFILLNYMKK